jgi:HNH endonuclease
MKLEELIRPSPFPGYYVTWEGRILSFWRGQWGERKPQIDRNIRYVRTCVMMHGKRKYVPIHRLVCETWNGTPPFPGAEARHLNDDPMDNRPTNLQWGSRKENARDAVLNGKYLRGSLCPASRLTVEEVKEIRRTYRPGFGNALAKKFGVTPRAIKRIILKETWRTES